MTDNAGLVFSQTPAQNAQLVFGGTGAAAAPTISGMLTIRMPGLEFSAAARYQSRAQRPLVSNTGNSWQSAGGLSAGVQARHEIADRVQATLGNAWQQAVGQLSSAAMHHQDTLRLRASPVSGFESALAAHGEAIAVASQDAIRARSTVKSIFSAGQPAGRRLDSAYQDCLRDHRLSVVSVFAAGLRSDRPLDQKIALALPQRIGSRSMFQSAIRPNGKIIPVVPPVIPISPCYVPSGNLVFSYPLGVPGELLFICDRAESKPAQPAIVIPVRGVYFVTNQVSLYRVSDGAEIPAFSLSISVSADSWVPGLQASLPAAALPLVRRNPDPVEVVAVVNGSPFHFFVKSIRRGRSFGKGDISISGDGIACELDSPMAAEQQYSWGAARTAQQLVSDALQFTGYSIDWQITDWLVPANVASVFGPPAAVAKMVAESVGGVLSGHRSSRILRVQPRYKFAPWEWLDATPDIQIPASVTEVENIDWVDGPDYNAVFVAGEQAGILGQIKRVGSAGDKAAQMVTHRLITHADAARQRGISILGQSGQKAMMQISLPILPETGVIDLGTLIEFSDGAETRRGIVRGNRIDYTAPKLRQLPTIEASA